MKGTGQHPQNIIPKDLRKLAREARHAGWTITVSRANHLHWRSPTGALVVTATTPGKKGGRLDVRAVRRALNGG